MNQKNELLASIIAKIKATTGNTPTATTKTRLNEDVFTNVNAINHWVPVDFMAVDKRVSPWQYWQVTIYRNLGTQTAADPLAVGSWKVGNDAIRHTFIKAGDPNDATEYNLTTIPGALLAELELTLP